MWMWMWMWGSLFIVHCSLFDGDKQGQGREGGKGVNRKASGLIQPFCAGWMILRDKEWAFVPAEAGASHFICHTIPYDTCMETTNSN